MPRSCCAAIPPACSAICFSRRGSSSRSAATCGAWPRRPHPFLLVLGPEEAQSLARLPRVREVATYRGLPATALTFGGLVGGMEAQTLALVANFATDDPVAEIEAEEGPEARAA